MITSQLDVCQLFYDKSKFIITFINFYVTTFQQQQQRNLVKISYMIKPVSGKIPPMKNVPLEGTGVG